MSVFPHPLLAVLTAWYATARGTRNAGGLSALLWVGCASKDGGGLCAAHVLRTEPSARVHREVRTFGTITADLLALNDWLNALGVEPVALESTGVYWRLVFTLLEADHEVILVNAQHLKAVPGRTTDVKDSEWLADRLRHGLVQASFIPPQPVRELRALTR